MLKLSKTVTRSAEDYVPALIEACTKGGGVDPVLVLTETAAYPKVVKAIDMAEFIVGWFHGVAEAYDTEVKDLWGQLAAGRGPVATPKRKAPAAKRTAPAPAPIAVLPTEGYGSPAVGALTGKRKAKKVEAPRVDPPKRAPHLRVAPPVPVAPPAVTHPVCPPCTTERGAVVAHAPPYCSPTPPKRARRKRVPATQAALPMNG